MSVNPFDQFGSGTAGQQNAFDQFDAGMTQPTNPKQNKGTAGDLATSVKRGVLGLPGIVTGLADLAPALGFGLRPFEAAAKYAGEVTGFQPGKWADEAQREYSPSYLQAQENIKPALDQTKKELDEARGFSATLGAGLRGMGAIGQKYIENPSAIGNVVAEALPQVAAGGVISKGLMGVGKVATMGEPALAGAAGFLERKLGLETAAAVAGGAGEGLMQAGSALNEATGTDQRKNAVAAISSGLLDAVIGAGSGKVVQAMGLDTLETAMAKGFNKSVTGELSGKAAALSKTGKIIGGGASEGILQELPQSAQETVFQNYAEGKPLWENVPRSAVEGLLAGFVMGAGANALPATTVKPDPKTDKGQSGVLSMMVGQDVTVNGGIATYTSPDGESFNVPVASLADHFATGGTLDTLDSATVTAPKLEALKGTLSYQEIADLRNSDELLREQGVSRRDVDNLLLSQVREVPGAEPLVRDMLETGTVDAQLIDRIKAGEYEPDPMGDEWARQTELAKATNAAALKRLNETDQRAKAEQDLVSYWQQAGMVQSPEEGAQEFARWNEERKLNNQPPLEAEWQQQKDKAMATNRAMLQRINNVEQRAKAEQDVVSYWQQQGMVESPEEGRAIIKSWEDAVQPPAQPDWEMQTDQATQRNTAAQQRLNMRDIWAQRNAEMDTLVRQYENENLQVPGAPQQTAAPVGTPPAGSPPPSLSDTSPAGAAPLWRQAGLDTKAPIALDQVQAKKQTDGTYKLVYRGTENEIFTGQTFKSAPEARAVFKREQALAQQTANAPDTLFAQAPTPSQFNVVDIEAPKFKEWFADSKVVDDAGKPQVVYHGTRTKGGSFESFELSKIGSKTDSGYMGEGFYFGDSRTASAYAGHYEFDPEHYPQGGAIYPAFISIKNPLVLKDRRENGRRVDLDVLAKEALGLGPEASSSELKEVAINKGYDGAIYQVSENGYREYVVFSPTQIKSAISNTGDFSATDPRIQFSEGQAQGAPQEQVTTALKSFIGDRAVDNLIRKGKVEIVSDVSQVPNTAKLDARQRRSVLGAYNSGQGKVFLVAGNLDPARVPEIMRHEVVHALLREDSRFMLRREGILKSFNALAKNNASVQAALAKVPTGTAESIRLEEGLAYWVQQESNHKHSLFKRIISAVKSGLARLGIPVGKYSTTDLSRMFTGGMEAWVNQGQESAGQDEGSLFAREASYQYRQLAKGEVPERTQVAYKLMRVFPSEPGRLFPLYARPEDGGKQGFSLGKWYKAENQRPSIGGRQLADRAGIHAVDLPIFSQGKANVKGEKRVWVEVLMPAMDPKTQAESDTTPLLKNGQRQGISARLIGPKEAYNYRTNPSATGAGAWPIAGSMSPVRVLSDSEVTSILKANGSDEHISNSLTGTDKVAADKFAQLSKADTSWAEAPDTLFAMADASMQQSSKSLTQKIKDFAEDKTLDNAPRWLSIAPLHTLVQTLGKKIPQIKQLSRHLEESEYISNDLINQAYEYIKRADTFTPVIKEALNQAAFKATSYQMSPAKPMLEQEWVPQDKKTREDKLKGAQMKWKAAGMDTATGETFISAYNKASAAYKAINNEEAERLYGETVTFMRDIRKREYNNLLAYIEKATTGNKEAKESVRAFIGTALPKEQIDAAFKGSEADYKAVLDYVKANSEDKALLKAVSSAKDNPSLRDQLLLRATSSFKNVKGDYWPLTRIGDYKLEFTDIDGVKVVKHYDTAGARRADEEMFIRNGVKKESFLRSKKDRRPRGEVAIPMELMEQLSASVYNQKLAEVDPNDSDAVTEARAEAQEVVEDMNQIWLRWQPETSSLKSSIQRKTVRGADEDMLRASLEYARKHASNIAWSEQGRQIEGTLKNLADTISEERKQGVDVTSKGMVLTEMRNRLQSIRDAKTGPIASFIGKAGTAMYMTSPSMALVQMTQLPMLTFPKLAVKYGSITKATAALMRATGMSFSKEFTKKKIFGDIAVNTLHEQMRETVTEEVRASEDAKLKARAEGKMLGDRLYDDDYVQEKFDGFTPKQQKLFVLREALARNLLDISASHEAYALEQGKNPNGVGSRVFNLAMQPMKISEMASRKAAILATMELAQGQGKSFKRIMNNVSEVVNDTLYSYSKANKPAVLQGGTAKVLAMFQWYRIMTALRMGMLAKRSFAAETPEIKAAARKEFIGIMGMTTVLAGSLGLPLMKQVFAALDALADDDEPRDSALEFRQWAMDRLGPTWGEAFTHGLPAAFLGVNASKRIGLGDVYGFQSEPPSRLHGKELAAWWAANQLGPAFGIVQGGFQGYDHFSKGEYMKGLEAAMPKPLKDGLRAARVMQEGDVKSLTGRRTLAESEMTADAVILLALGLNPAEIAAANKVGMSKSRIGAQLTERRGRVIDVMVQALEGDGDMEKARETLVTYNKKLPRFAIRGGDIRSALIRKMKEDRGIESRRDQLISSQYGL